MARDQEYAGECRREELTSEQLTTVHMLCKATLSPDLTASTASIRAVEGTRSAE